MLYTRERGKVSAVAKGTKRPRSKFAGSLQLFSHASVQVAAGRSLEVVSQVAGFDEHLDHAVAALLNAASPDVEYDYSVEQVITLFNAAYASADAGAIENQKDGFDFLNNQGCPLD